MEVADESVCWYTGKTKTVSFKKRISIGLLIKDDV